MKTFEPNKNATGTHTNHRKSLSLEVGYKCIYCTVQLTLFENLLIGT